jgi:hypothetical protein
MRVILAAKNVLQPTARSWLGGFLVWLTRQAHGIIDIVRYHELPYILLIAET